METRQASESTSLLHSQMNAEPTEPEYIPSQNELTILRNRVADADRRELALRNQILDLKAQVAVLTDNEQSDESHP